MTPHQTEAYDMARIRAPGAYWWILYVLWQYPIPGMHPTEIAELIRRQKQEKPYSVGTIEPRAKELTVMGLIEPDDYGHKSWRCYWLNQWGRQIVEEWELGNEKLKIIAKDYSIEADIITHKLAEPTAAATKVRDRRIYERMSDLLGR